MSGFLSRAKYLLSETEPNALEQAHTEVAFIGRSNVGKSSLLNAVCERKGLANVSKTPGRTRAINVFAVEHLCWIVDLPGYGFAVGPASSREKWPQMIEGYFTTRTSLRAIFLLIDCKVGPTTLDHQMVAWLKALNLPLVLVGNKLDKVGSAQRGAQQERIAKSLGTTVAAMRWVSASKGIGIPPLRNEIIKLLEWKK